MNNIIHTIKNGAAQIDGCAKHVRDIFLSQGYKVEVEESHDKGYREVFVRVANIKGTAEGLLKTATGLDVGVNLKLWENGDDLRFYCAASKINLAMRAMLGGGMGIFNPLMYAGSWHEKHLLDNVLRVVITFFKNDIVTNVVSGTDKE